MKHYLLPAQFYNWSPTDLPLFPVPAGHRIAEWQHANKLFVLLQASDLQ